MPLTKLSGQNESQKNKFSRSEAYPKKASWAHMAEEYSPLKPKTGSFMVVNFTWWTGFLKATKHPDGNPVQDKICARQGKDMIECRTIFHNCTNICFSYLCRYRKNSAIFWTVVLLRAMFLPRHQWRTLDHIPW